MVDYYPNRTKCGYLCNNPFIILWKHSFYYLITRYSEFRVKQEPQPYFTFKQGSDVPHVDAARFHELPQGDFQEEDGDSSHKDDQQVGDQEDACGDEEQALGSEVDHHQQV